MPTARELEAFAAIAGSGTIVVKDANCQHICVPCETPGLCDLCPGWEECYSENYCLTITGLEVGDGAGGYQAPLDVQFHVNLWCIVGCTGHVFFAGFIEFGPQDGGCGCASVPPYMEAWIICNTPISTCAERSDILGKWSLFLQVQCCTQPGAFASRWWPGSKECPNIVFDGALPPISGPLGNLDCGYRFSQAVLSPGTCTPSITGYDASCYGSPIPGDPDGPPIPVDEPPRTPWGTVPCCTDPNPPPGHETTATVTGGGTPTLGVPDCSCMDGTMTFRWWTGLGPTNGYGWTGTYAPACVTDTTGTWTVPYYLEVNIVCNDDGNWEVFAYWNVLSGPGYVRFTTTGTNLLFVPPCSPGYPPHYFELTIIDNPPDDFPCYNSFTIINGA